MGEPFDTGAQMAEYLLARVGAEEIERERLTLVERYHDPLTARQLERIGVSEGWRCLDVGAGGGSVTRMLAERVGPTGSVLATDLDPRMLLPIANGRIRVLRHDLLVDPLPEAAFDMVHARLLLIHLSARLGALSRMLKAVRPGGWLAALDVDFTTVEVSPAPVAWTRTWSAFMDAVVAGGWDPHYGARLADDLDALELEGIEAESVRMQGRGRSLPARLLSLTLERLRPQMVGVGARDSEIDAARRLLEDASTKFASQTTVLAYGRRPT